MRYALPLTMILAASAAAAPIDKFVDEHTFIVARIDLSKVDAGEASKLLRGIVGTEPADSVAAWVKEFVRIGGKDLWIVYGTTDYPHAPCLLVNQQLRDTHEVLGPHTAAAAKSWTSEAKYATKHGFVIAGSPDAVAALKARKAVARPDISAALDVGKDAVAQVAFAPSASARKAFAEIAPTLPVDLGGGSISAITDGMKWLSLAVGPGPNMPVTQVVEAASPEAAVTLKGIDARLHRLLLTELFRIPGEADADLAARLDKAVAGRRQSTEGNRLVSEWELGTTLNVALSSHNAAPADRARSQNNLKQLLLALHNYHDAYGRFPADIVDKDGKPLLSWRVAILPFIEQENLYKKFKLDEPWDSEHNRKLAVEVKTFRSPRQAQMPREKTTYLAPRGKGLAWDEPKGLPISEIRDGTSNTILLVESDDDRGVTWTKPEDITIDPKDPFAGLLGHYTEGFHAGMADGSVRFVEKTLDPKKLWAMFTRSGGETIK